MAATLVLEVIQAPITPDHLVCALRNTVGSGFFVDQYRWNLGENPTPDASAQAEEMSQQRSARADAAEARIRANDDLAQLTLASRIMRNVRDTRGMERSPGIQMGCLCPRLVIGENSDIEEDQDFWGDVDFWGLPGSVQVVNDFTTEAVLLAMTSAKATPDAIAAAQAFLAEHFGKSMLIMPE